MTEHSVGAVFERRAVYDQEIQCGAHVMVEEKQPPAPRHPGTLIAGRAGAPFRLPDDRGGEARQKLADNLATVTLAVVDDHLTGPRPPGGRQRAQGPPQDLRAIARRDDDADARPSALIAPCGGALDVPLARDWLNSIGGTPSSCDSWPGNDDRRFVAALVRPLSRGQEPVATVLWRA